MSKFIIRVPLVSHLLVCFHWFLSKIGNILKCFTFLEPLFQDHSKGQTEILKVVFSRNITAYFSSSFVYFLDYEGSETCFPHSFCVMVLFLFQCESFS